jgi:hypothetical protein
MAYAGRKCAFTTWYNKEVKLVFLLLEEDDIVFLGKVTALIRGDGETAILMRDNTVQATGFTPLTLQRRSGKFWKNCLRKEPR